MKIDNEFTVSVPIDQAWEVLTDLAGIAPCLPGAQLTGSEGDTYMGKIKIKVGPVTSEYAGTASFSEKDHAAYRAVIDAKGRDPRGAGNASATITASLRPDGACTVVSVDTDLKISGKIAQFGNSMIAEVSEKLLGQFVDCLEGKLAPQQLPAPMPEAPAPKATDPQGGVVTIPKALTVPRTRQPAPEPEALDLMQLAGGSVAKRMVPVAIGVAVLAAVMIYRIVR
jgi:carbon monoxide dehydrogenase subunit G